MPYKPREREYRAIASFDFSESADHGELILRGRPILFDAPTVICVIDGIERKEVIAKGALDECDMSDFILNRNHGMNDSTVFARTRNESLKYLITDSSLEIEGHLDSEDERHVNLYRDVQKRRVDKMSFSFVPKEEAYDREKQG